MPIVIEPYIPETITVHLGPPNSPAENVTVSFPDYVKNVASSEIYPTWEPAAIRANVLAIISFAFTGTKSFQMIRVFILVRTILSM